MWRCEDKLITAPWFRPALTQPTNPTDKSEGVEDRLKLSVHAFFWGITAMTEEM
jgi:hypothetical protein